MFESLRVFGYENLIKGVFLMANKTKNLDLIKDVFYMITKQLFMQYLVLIKLNLLVKIQ